MLLAILFWQAVHWWTPKQEREILYITRPSIQPAPNTYDIMAPGYSKLPSIVILDIMKTDPLPI